MSKFKKKPNYKDEEVKNFCIKMFKEYFNLEFKLNDRSKWEAKYGIDLIHTTIPNFGAELEQGGWSGNFWETKIYQWMPKINGNRYEFGLINMPIRKRHFWIEEKDEGHDKNLFVRTNSDFTQFIIIRPDSIKNKFIPTTFLANNNDKEEEWLSWKKEDVETYSLIDNKWILI